MKFGRCWFGKLVVRLGLGCGDGNYRFFVCVLIFVVLLSVVVGSGFMFAQSNEVSLSSTVEPLLDMYGVPTVNEDGTFYPNDQFKIAYHTELANDILFESVEVIYDIAVFNMFDHSDFGSPSGVCSFQVLSSALAGTYPIHFRVQGNRLVDNTTQSYTTDASVLIAVVEYDPHFSVELTYTIPNSGSGSSFDKPFALIVRYDGNGQDYNLRQRAIIDDYFYTGYAQKIPDLDTIQVTPNVTTANFFSKNANVQFIAHDVGNRVSQPVLTLDNVPYKCNELPLSFLWDTNTNHTYVWAQNLTATSDSNGRVEEWFEWQFCNIFPPSTNGLDLSQINSGLTQEDLQNQLMAQFNSLNGTLTVTQLGNTVTAIYAQNKHLDLFAKDAGVDQNQALQCQTTTPLYFTSEERYAKLQYALDSKVAKEITQQNFTSALYYDLSIGCNWFGQPRYFYANFTADYEFYDKLVNVTAYRWNQALEEWSIDDTVSIRAVFESALSFTEHDVLRSNLENQTTDQTALKMACEDLYDCGAQSFVGAGSIEQSLKRSSPLYYELLIEAGQSTKITLQRTIELNFRDDQTYTLPLNFDTNSPLPVTILTDDTQSTTLQLDAPTELGGLTNITIYQITNTPSERWETLAKTQLDLKLLKTLELTTPQQQTQTPLNYEQDFEQFYQYYEGGSAIFDDNWGFKGQTQIAIQKNQATTALTNSGEALLYVEATNVWDTTFHTIIPIQPYSKPKWELPLTQATLYLLVIVILAVILSFVVWFIKTE